MFNDALVEITITLASTYLTFYIGEEVLGVSGVIAVVMLGIQINALRTSISPEVEVFLHRYTLTLFLEECLQINANLKLYYILDHAKDAPKRLVLSNHVLPLSIRLKI